MIVQTTCDLIILDSWTSQSRTIRRLALIWLDFGYIDKLKQVQGKLIFPYMLVSVECTLCRNDWRIEERRIAEAVCQVVRMRVCWDLTKGGFFKFNFPSSL